MHQVTSSLDIGNMPTKVWFEPWGMPIVFPAGTSLKLVAEGQAQGNLEIVNRDGEIFVYAWPTSVLKVYQDDQVVQSFFPPVPNVPTGWTVRSFVDKMFGDPSKS